MSGNAERKRGIGGTPFGDSIRVRAWRKREVRIAAAAEEPYTYTD